MAVVSGTTALKTQFSTLKDEVNRWFADNYAGTLSFGDGNQTYGWGGNEASDVFAGQRMESGAMNGLINRCNIGVEIVSSVSGLLTEISGGDIALASVFNAIESKSDLLTTGRLTIDAAETSILSGGSSVRSTNWSSAVDCTFRYTFTDFDEARYFFNSGGSLSILGSISGYSTSFGFGGQSMNQIFNVMGTISMNHTETTQSGSGGFPSATGYYDLTTSFVSIFSQSGGAPYGTASITVQARRSSSGDWVELKVTLIPPGGDTIDGTTTITTNFTKLNSKALGTAALIITSPTYSLINAL